ncbi:MAG TPA: GNAT family N-acetyltransferase [Alphaproteobacteria bacterium]|nr:GNAT family N-acetyltransferase [Alphaproteobacteria bacterium]
MIDLAHPYRHARPSDARALSTLIDLAGDGLPSYLWAGMAQAGETAADVGARRAQREEGSFSYRNAVVADEGAGAIAALIGYPLAAEPTAITSDMPAMFVPLQELENLACGSWHINALAVAPERQGRGCGTALLALAERLMSASGCRGLSLIVSDANAGARRLYARCGFRAVAARAIVKGGWDHAGSQWHLMVRDRSRHAP